MAQVKAGAASQPVQVSTPVGIPKPIETSKPVEAAKAGPTEGAQAIDRKPQAAPLATHNTPGEKARAHGRYDTFLAQHGLTPAQIDRFVELKLAIADAQEDLQAAVEHNGAQGGTEGVEALRSSLTKPMWDEIRQLLGGDGFKAYGEYERVSAFRPTVASLFQASGVSVSEQQMDQIARIVLTDSQTYRAKPTDISMQIQIDWNAVARDAETLLTPAQIAVIRAHAARESARLTNR